MLETITLNVTAGPARLVQEGGREWLVAPAVSITPGVLPGSKGPLLYPESEVARNVRAWDRVPLVLYHPSSPTGQHLSAKSPGVLDRQGIGEVRESRFDGKLRHNLYFDVERTRKLSPQVYHALLNGVPIELSTGLFTDNREVPGGAYHNGRWYSHIARRYSPDHIAILPDQKGACSIQDGCGVLVNTYPQQEIQHMDLRTIAAIATRGIIDHEAGVAYRLCPLTGQWEAQLLAANMVGNCDCYGEEMTGNDMEDHEDDDDQDDSVTNLDDMDDEEVESIANAALKGFVGDGGVAYRVSPEGKWEYHTHAAPTTNATDGRYDIDDEDEDMEEPVDDSEPDDDEDDIDEEFNDDTYAELHPPGYTVPDGEQVRMGGVSPLPPGQGLAGLTPRQLMGLAQGQPTGNADASPTYNFNPAAGPLRYGPDLTNSELGANAYDDILPLPETIFNSGARVIYNGGINDEEWQSYDTSFQREDALVPPEVVYDSLAERGAPAYLVENVDKRTVAVAKARRAAEMARIAKAKERSSLERAQVAELGKRLEQSERILSQKLVGNAWDDEPLPIPGPAVPENTGDW